MSSLEIRREILSQHDELRTMIEETRASVAPTGEPDGNPDRFACMDRLAGALQAHNRREEALLKGLLATVDAWGPARAEIMDARHLAEHEELHAALVDVLFDAEGVGPALDRILQHMAYEESAFLGEDVLRDDTIVIDAQSG
jgi:hypothetical protein